MPKKRSGCHRRPRRSAKPTTNKSMKCGGRTHSTAIQTAKGQACGMRTRLTEMNFITNLNIEMKKLFVAVTVASLATMLVSVSAHAGGLAFDAAGNLFERGKDSIFKFTPDGKKSTFASGLSTYGVYNLAFDAAGNLFVADEDSHSILKFTPDGKKSTFATGFNQIGRASCRERV